MNALMHRLAKCECSDAQAGLSHLLKFMDTFTRDITNQQVFVSLFTDRGKVCVCWGGGLFLKKGISSQRE